MTRLTFRKMRSSKSRSRTKPNRNRPSGGGGNVVNRVFDSSGPEGKVRGTPQQIIDKYNQLARDAHLSNDRVAAENFQQHAEHYRRLLGDAQREQYTRREEQDARREEQERQNRERQAERDRDRVERAERVERQERDSNAPVVSNQDPAEAPQPDVLDVVGAAAPSGDSGLVETPEGAPKKPRRRSRKPLAKPQDVVSEVPAAREPAVQDAEPQTIVPVKEGDTPEAAE
jgi:hypothetical protein